MRTQTISTTRLKAYKGFVAFCFIGVVLFILVGLVFYQKAYLNGSLLLITWTGLFYQRMKRLLQLKKVEFDETNLYYELDGYEEQIPFQQIKDINLIAFSGVFEIKLYSPSQEGKSLFFKPSVWYPLNFGKVDEKVERLKELVKSARKNRDLQDRQQAPYKAESKELESFSGKV